ncbi:MAG: hypothetical protein MUP34_03115 [Candidatus Atribacteria bacterium]|nr:hypothetical protein [Candidatus Atribacteria bacterium]
MMNAMILLSVKKPICCCSGTTCPIECTAEFLDESTYFVVVTLGDNVGLKRVYYALIVLGVCCDIDITYGKQHYLMNVYRLGNCDLRKYR